MLLITAYLGFFVVFEAGTSIHNSLSEAIIDKLMINKNEIRYPNSGNLKEEKGKSVSFIINFYFFKRSKIDSM